MDRLQTNRVFVRQFCKLKDEKQLKKLVQKASPEQIKTIVDLTLNVMNKNLPANKKAIEFIKAKRNSIRHILHPKYSLDSKRRYLVQKGGGIFAPLLTFFSKYRA